MNHPSSFALDCVALGEPQGELADHLAGCAGCRAYLEHRARVPAIPAWLGARPRSHRWGLALAAATALAAAACLLFVVRPRMTTRDADEREKGPPMVTVYLKRDDRVSAWDGRPIRPGDQLRLQVRGGGFRHVSVASLPPGGPPQVLYTGVLEGDGPHLLPLSFQADAEGDREVLSVALGPRELAPEAHLDPQLQSHSPSIDGLWTTRLTMTKERP
jgi:hypothetical protein